MFSQEQISVSLQAMVIMDQEQLNSDILSALPKDPLYIAHLKEPKPRWSVTPNGFLQHDSLIYPQPPALSSPLQAQPHSLWTSRSE